jgi:hypothetical protein
MFRKDNTIAVAVKYFLKLLYPVFFSTVLFLPLTLQADSSSGTARFTLQREKTPETDFASLPAIRLPEIEIIEKSGAYQIKVVAVIDAPARYVRHVLTDYSHIYRLNPAITESEVIKQDDVSVSVRTRINGCASYFCEELNRVEKVQLLPSGEIYAETVPEHGQFKSGQTHWRIKALGERCEVTYLSNMEPDIFIPPVVSKFLVKKAIRQEAQISFANLEKISSALCIGRGGATEKLSVCD